jgi:anti-anti-sigma factor
MSTWPLSFEITSRKDVLVVKPIGRIDGQDYLTLDGKLAELSKQGHRRLVLDLSAAQVVGSTALGVLLLYSQLLREQGGCLALVVPEGTSTRILRLADMGEAICICASLEEAVDLAAGRGQG